MTRRETVEMDQTSAKLLILIDTRRQPNTEGKYNKFRGLAKSAAFQKVYTLASKAGHSPEIRCPFKKKIELNQGLTTDCKPCRIRCILMDCVTCYTTRIALALSSGKMPT